MTKYVVETCDMEGTVVLYYKDLQGDSSSNPLVLSWGLQWRG